MPILIKLNNYGSLGVTIPKPIVETLKLKAGDKVDMEIKSIDPVVIAFKKMKPIEW